MKTNANNGIEIRGNTYPVKNRLSALGCRWDGDKRCWMAKTEAMAEQARAIVGGTSLPPSRGTSPAPASDVVTSAAGSIFGKKASLTSSFTPAPLRTDIKWSSEQLAIFTWFRSGKGCLVVRARAGTGKTFTITYAVSQAPESLILYVVFNKKNAREAEGKITDPRVTVATLHKTGYGFVLNFWPGVRPDDAVEHDRILAAAPTTPPDEVVSCIERLVGFAKNLFTGLPTVDQLADLAEDKDIFAGAWEEPEQGGWVVTKLASVARGAMEAAMKRDLQNRISFNDMVWLPVAMNWVTPTYDLVVVDEAQDMNVPQLAMARRAVKVGGRVVVVGDDRQAIYGFRGACQDGLDMMKRELNAAELGLTVTFRCPKQVVALAAALVPDYTAAPEAPEGVVEHLNEWQMVEQLAVGDAVLSRINATLMPLCLSMLRKGIPARIEGRDIGRQLVGMVRKLKARTVPEFLRKLAAWGEKATKRAMAAKKAASSKVDQINDMVDTLVAVADGVSSVREIEERLQNLFQDSDQTTKPAVVLSSVHKAKGLEWTRVFLMRETFNRGGKRQMTDEEVRQEQNVYYVALTRSKNYLGMVHTGGQAPAVKN